MAVSREDAGSAGLPHRERQFCSVSGKFPASRIRSRSGVKDRLLGAEACVLFLDHNAEPDGREVVQSKFKDFNGSYACSCCPNPGRFTVTEALLAALALLACVIISVPRYLFHKVVSTMAFEARFREILLFVWVFPKFFSSATHEEYAIGFPCYQLWVCSPDGDRWGFHKS
jgi:hypothetical protein